MKILLVLWVVGATGLGAVAGGIRVDPRKLPPPAQKTGISYATDIRPILQASCFRCHGPDRYKAGLRLDSLKGVLEGGKDGKVVVPGNSQKSLIVLATSRLDPELSMPPKPDPSKSPGGKSKSGWEMEPPPKPLTAEQVGLLRAWIDQGCK